MELSNIFSGKSDYSHKIYMLKPQTIKKLKKLNQEINIKEVKINIVYDFFTESIDVTLKSFLFDDLNCNLYTVLDISDCFFIDSTVKSWYYI